MDAVLHAGRSAKQALLYTEIAEGMNAYGVSKHRHMPEIEQVLRSLPSREGLDCTSSCTLTIICASRPAALDMSSQGSAQYTVTG